MFTEKDAMNDITFSDNTSSLSFLEKLLYKKGPKFHPTKSYPPEDVLFAPFFDDGLTFFSKFECGNLSKAIRVSETEYELLLEEDFNTSGHFHWFYFRTKSRLPVSTTVRFKILNMMKTTSLYSSGFQPFAYSLKKFNAKGVGWHTTGKNVAYYKNRIQRKKEFTDLGYSSKNNQYFYTLEWTYEFEYPQDEVYFAQFPPYAYTDLLKNLTDIQHKNGIKDIMRMSVLCKTHCDNSCPMITITENVGSYLPYHFELMLGSKPISARRAVLESVTKLRARLLKKQAGIKNKMSAKFNYTHEDFAEFTKTKTLSPQKLADLVEPDYKKEHELEGIPIKLTIIYSFVIEASRGS